MDAVRYILERNRICETHECGNCPLYDGEKYCHEEDAEIAVKIVEEWSRENPVTEEMADIFPWAEKIWHNS